MPAQRCLFMNNEDIKREADRLIQECRLPALLAEYADWFIDGSYSYDLMCWRDLDIYVLDPDYDLKHCFVLGYELTARLAAKKSRFTNNLGGEPHGLYWGIKLGDERQGAWKLDVWILDQTGYERHADYSTRLRERVSEEQRSIILAIKEAYWQQPSFRVTVTSDMIYRAVLDRGVKTVEDFERSLLERPSSEG
jgi:hypothetical protein